MAFDGEVADLFGRVITGDDEALGELLQRYQPLLTEMSREHLPDQIRPRVGESDVVQASFLSAIRHFQEFSGNEPAQFVAWLKQIHRQNLKDAQRDHFNREKRALGRETATPSLDHENDSRQLTPSVWAIQKEDRAAVINALSSLPEQQAIAVRLRHLEGRKLKQIAIEMDRTPQAVAGLLKREQYKGVRYLLRFPRTTEVRTRRLAPHPLPCMGLVPESRSALTYISIDSPP